MRLTRFLVLCALAACGGADEHLTQAAPGAEDPCGALPATLTLSEGGRALLARGALVDSAVVGEGVAVVPEESRFVVREAAPQVGGAVRVQCAGRQVAIPVTVQPLTWSKLAQWKGGAKEGAEGPLGREYFSMWLDEARPNQLFVFGGFVYEPKQFTPASDLWRFDLGTSTFRKLIMSGEPPLSPGGRVAPIPGEDALFYFGGASVKPNGALATAPLLKRLSDGADSAAWSDAADASRSTPSYTGAFVYDSKRQRWLSICGMDTDRGVHCQVDAYTTKGGWAAVATAGKAPRGRSGFHYAYDQEADRVVLFGGALSATGGSVAGDTWSLNLAESPPRWTLLFESDPAAAPRRNGAWVYDPVGHRLLVWGGTANGRTAIPGSQSLSLTANQERWTSHEVPREVPPRASGMGVYDAAQRRAVLGFGNETAIYTDLWALAL